MPRPKLARPLTVEALEGRRVCAAGASAAFAFFDVNLTASVQPLGDGTDVVVVDGSDFADGVTVTAYDPAKGDVTVRLQEFAGRTPFSFDTTVTLHSDHLSPFAPVSVKGRGGNDQVINRTAAPTFMDGEGGRDLLRGGPASDHLDGGPGDDTLVGGAGNDGLAGGGGKDSMRGGLGNDVLGGGADDDTMFGEDGDDVVDGEDGNDRLYGDYDGSGAGNDTLYGGVGDDTLHGGGGADLMYGSDVVSGDGLTPLDSAGKDVLYGENGNDTMFGGGGNDYLSGGRGADWLYGEGGVDRLHGGEGDDHLDGGYDDPDSARDVLWGDSGADTFVRHRYALTLGLSDDADRFADFNAGQGDREESDWHW